MLIKTHLAITLAFVLLLLNFVEAKIIFIVVALIATFIPDVDARFSTIGSKKIARILQFFTKHRGVIHSFTFLFIITAIFVLFLPVVALPFFLGYSLHLFADSFTRDGIFPFYPYKEKSYWRIRSGGKLEMTLLMSFTILDIFLLVVIVTSMF